MTGSDIWLLVTALVLVVVAGALAMVETALARFSRARADELAADGLRRARRLRTLVEDPAPALNTALLLRMVAEITAVVLVAIVCENHLAAEWMTAVIAAGAMVIVSFIVIGVAPRTIGRQHSETVALYSAGPLLRTTTVFGPLLRLLIWIGNAVTPGKGFQEGPFGTEAELRELVDLAEQGRIIESDERAMIHSVFELGDTSVREVMVPRTDVVFIEATKSLRQFQSLALRS
ncbi:MAG TPA: CNNM domain-containing protein, partial [Jiangellaceae bacterium]|nr:CNNM domain-containing protein [Jiangellaceae bacterium]